MDGKSAKWFFIAMAIPLVAVSIGQAIDNYSKNNAKRDIIVACYQAGNGGCDELWKREIK